MNIQYKLTTDLMHPGVMPRVDVVQGDVYSRSIELSFYQEEFLWKIPENAHISLRYAKPDGTRGIYDTLPDGTAAYICHDNVVEFTLAPQMLTVPGPVLAQVVILQGKKQLASFTMQIHVHSDPSAGATTSEDYVNWMDTVIGSQVDRIFQEAKDSGVFNGPAGKTPRIEAARFQENLRTGVKLTVINPGEGNQLDQETRVQLFDGEKGASGVTPNIQRVEVQMLEPGMDAAGEFSGTAEDLTLKLAIPQSTPGRDGQTPAFRLASAYMLPYGANPEVTISGPTADLRMQLGIPEGAPGPAGPQGEPGKSPKISVGNYSDASGRTGVTMTIENPDSSVPKLVVLYDGKDGKDYTPKPVLFTISGDDRKANAGLYPYEDTSRYATAEELLDAYFGGGAYVVFHKDDPRQGPNRIVGFSISGGNVGAVAKDPSSYYDVLSSFKICTEDEFYSARAKYLT